MDIKPTIYADYNSTSPMRDEVRAKMLPFLSNAFGNPSSLHTELGTQASLAIEEARVQIALLLDAQPEEVIFVSGGTESCFQAILGVALWHISHHKELSILSSSVEHPSVHQAIHTAQLFAGFSSDTIPVDSNGVLQFDAIPSYPGSLLLSVMAANNETGISYPLDRVLESIQCEHIIYHSDLVQIISKKEFSFRESPLHLGSLSAHKIGGPKGIGALLIREGTPWVPPMPGGGQESARRGGTPSVANIVGFGEAARLSRSAQTSENSLAALRDSFEQHLLQNLGEIEILGFHLERLPNTSSILIEHVSAAQLISSLSNHGVCISKGSACKSGESGISHVLSAMGRSERESRSHIRVSFGAQSSSSEGLQLAEYVIREVETQRATALAEVSQLLRSGA